MSGVTQTTAALLTRMISNDFCLNGIVQRPVALLLKSKCGFVGTMESIVGFSFVAILCATMRDRCSVGTAHAPISKTGGEPRINCGERTQLCVRSSTRRR